MSRNPSPAPPAPGSAHTRPTAPDRAFTRLSPRELVLLAGITAAAPLTIDLYLPAYPQLAAEFGVAETRVQLTLTSCVVGLALGQLILGPVADRVGRRGPVVVGALAWSVASLLAAFAPTLELLVAARFCQGFAAAAGVVAARAVLRDLSSGDALARAMARLFLVLGLVPMLAPALGSVVLVLTSWRGLFVLLAVSGVVLAVVSAALLVETLPAERRRPVAVRALAGTYGRLLVDRTFMAPALAASLSFAGLFAWINGSSFVLQEQFGVSPLGYGLVFALLTAVLVAGSQLSARLTARFGLLPVIRSAPLVAAAAVGVVVVSGLVGTVSPVLLVGGVATAMATIGVMMPASAAYALTGQPPARAGLASGLLGVVQFAVGGLTSPLASIGGQVSATSMTALMLLLFLGSAGSAAATVRR